MINLIESKNMAFLTFNKYKNDTKKTFDVVVLSKNDNFVLGNINWYPGWRRYVFQPANETIFDSTCLLTIMDYIDKLMGDRR